MLLLCALVVGSGSAWAVSAGDVFERISAVGDLSDGDEIIFVNQAETYACGTTQNTNNRTPVAISVSDHSYMYAAKDNVQVFVVKTNTITINNVSTKVYGFHTGSGYIYSGSSSNNYLKTNSTAASTAPSGTAAWTLSVSSNVFSATNVSNISYYLAFNGTSYFSQYKSGQSKPYIYKKKAASATALAVKTAPTKTNYKVGEKLNLTGLVLDATVSGNHVDVTSGYTATIGGSAATSGTTVLNTVGAQTITFTYGGKTATQTIHVGELTGIEITTEPDKTEYNEGQTFDPTGMVVEATFSDGEESATEWTEDVTEDCTFDPDTETALETSDTEITVSYEWDEVTKTADQDITVTAGVPYTVTFNAGSGSCATASLTEASFAAGVTLPTATISVTGWSFAGWATASTTNTELAPTLYAASSSYKPSDNVTLYAVYKFIEGTEGEYIRVTSLADVKAASKVILVNGGKTLTTDLSSKDALSESEGTVTAADKTVFTLSGNDTDGYTLTGASGTVGAASLPTSNGNYTSLSITSSNNTWSITTNSSTTNTFTFLNKGGTNVGLEYYSSGSAWVAYKTSSPTSSSYYATKVYIPNFAVAYNSNPAAMINPTVAFTTAGNKSLYVQDEASYTNAANVTGISKTPTYTSSDETVATVTSAGVVTALKAGSTTITAKVAKEVGVNSEASASYTVTVKDAKTIAGLKAITSTSTVVAFTADLTDATVTYVKGNHAFIQDASGAVYASCGSSLTAGDKINGAVTGSIKAANQIDEITAINLSEATVTDGDIPAAQVKTAAQLVANKADLEGKLVSIEGATVTASLTSGIASGGKISDDSKVTEINLYAPDSNIDALKDAEGTFNGYITLYGGSTIRFNIFEQSQITLTKNAPTDQPLTFASDAVELDEETAAYTAFTGQAVSGAQGTVTYSIDSDDDGVVTSINSSTGAVVLSGEYGTATIKASAAAKEVTVAGLTTPYKATAKTYTITVYPRYTVTFSINGVESEVRQATHGAEITVPTPVAVGDYVFIGWSTSTVAATNETPSMMSVTNPPTADSKYYAVYAIAEEGELVEHTSTFTIKQASAPSSPYVSNGSSWTWSNVTFDNSASACINKSNGSVTFTLPSGGKAKSLNITKTSNAWAAAAEVVLKDASSNEVNTYTGSSVSFNFTSGTYDQSSSYTLSNTTGSNAWIDKIDFVYEKASVTYSDYRTSLPIVEVTVTASGYLSYCSPHKLDFSETDVKAYKAAVDEDGKVTLTKVDIVPAEEGVILFSSEAKEANEATTYSIPVTDKTASDVTGNQMVGVLERTQVSWNDGDKYNYILQQGKFNKATNGYLKANRAYLSTSYDVSAASARELTIVFDDDVTTGISTLESTDSRKGIYNLAGQRLNSLQKGINIVNGKIIMVK